MITYAPEFREFYKLNVKCKQRYIYKHAAKQDYIDTLDFTKCFMLTMRCILDGVHKDINSDDYQLNMLNNFKKIPWDKTNNCASCNFIIFEHKKKKKTLARFLVI